MKLNNSSHWRLLAPLLIPLLATVTQWFLWDEVTPFTWFFYYPAAFLAALIGGLRGGILATLISAVLGFYIFNPPHFSFRFNQTSSLTSTGMFIVMGIVFSFFHERSRALGQKAARRESEERFAVFMAALPAHAWVKDNEGRYVYANDLLRRDVMTGIADYRGLTDVDFFPRDIADELRKNDQAILNSGKPLAFSEKTRSTKGMTRYWQTVKFPFVDAEKRSCVGGIAVDITQTKQTEEALRLARAGLELAQEAAGAGTWDWDIRAGKLQWSQQMFRLFGLDPAQAEASFDAWRSVLHEEDRDHVEKQMEEVIQKHLRLETVYRIVLLTGAVRWIHAIGNTIYDEDGTAQRMTGICLDITERKRAELSLLETQDQLNATLESIADGFVACDADWRFVYINSRAASMLGIRHENALGRTCWEVFAPAVGTRVEAEARGAANGEIREFEHFYEPLARWFKIRCFPRRGGGISAYFLDITERKAAEAAVRASEERYRLLAENTDDLVSLEDIEGRHLYVSPSYYRVTGWTPEDVEGSDWRSRIHTEDLPRIESSKSAARSGQPSIFEHRIRCRDKHWIWVEQRYQPVLDKTGHVFRVLLSARDITKRRQAEANLHRLNRMLRMINRCNLILVRASDENGLLHAICRIVVHSGGYRMAWVGMAEQDEAKSVRPVAQAGFVKGYLDTICITWADSERGRDPTGRAIRTRQPAISRNLLTDPSFAPWREAAIQRGYMASAALPLINEGHALGAFVVYATEPNMFDKSEVALLKGLADNMAFGINALRMRALERRRREELHQLSAHILQVQDQERRHLARELHDTTAQHLAALTLKLGDLRDLLAQTAGSAQGLCAECLNLARQSAQEIRTHSYLLHPPLLEVMGLIEAVDDYVQGFSVRSGIKVDLQASEPFGRLASEVELTLFRVVQESLTNVFKHSRSPRAEIRFTRSALTVMLEIRDVGQGIPADMLKRIKDLKGGLGVGLGGMQERLRHLGGQLELESGLTGTTVRATLPLSGKLPQLLPDT